MKAKAPQGYKLVEDLTDKPRCKRTASAMVMFEFKNRQEALDWFDSVRELVGGLKDCQLKETDALDWEGRRIPGGKTYYKIQKEEGR